MAATSGGAPTPWTKVRVTGAQADEFARKLASDDAFRAKLQSDPVGALRDLGIELPRGTTIDPEKVTLPSKEDAEAQIPPILKFFPVFGPLCPLEVT